MCHQPTTIGKKCHITLRRVYGSMSLNFLMFLNATAHVSLQKRMRCRGIGSAISDLKYMINMPRTQRQNALPQYLKREDWENFVDSEGSFEAQLRRMVGLAARASLKSPHTSGRKGQARVADELQQHPEREVTWCEIFIKTHYKKDGTATSHHVERLSRMCDDDPSIAYNDIDNDGFAKVFGTNTRGRVRGLGLGVSRSIVHNSNPYKRAYEEEHKSHVALETEVDGLKSRMEDMEKIVASLSQSGTQMRSSTGHESSSQVRPPSTHQETQASLRATLTGTYKLMHLRKSAISAYGSLMGISPDNSDYY